MTAQDLGLWDYTSFVYKSDQEPSILLLKREAVKALRERHGPLIRVEYEEPCVGESPANSLIERQIWEIEGLARTLIHAVETFQGIKTPLGYCVRLWAIEYAPQ